jgi:hypothetical protein
MFITLCINAEVRLLFQDIDPKQGNNGVFRYPLSPVAVFDEVVLDPRLKDADVAHLRDELIAAGCTLPINRSRLYRAPGLLFGNEIASIHKK